MANAELLYDDGTSAEPKKATIRIAQCKSAFIKQIFTLNQNFDIFLRKCSTNEFISPEESGVFNVPPGQYFVIVEGNGSGANSGIQTSLDWGNRVLENRRADHVYAGTGMMPTFTPTRPPVPPNVAIGAGFASPPIRQTAMLRNRSLNAQLFQPVEQSPVTIYFTLGKWTADGKIAKRKAGEVIEVPVTFATIDVHSVKQMNDKLSATINQDEELRDGKNTNYEIYKPNQAKLRDNPEIHSLSYWAAEAKKKSQSFYALPVKPPLFESTDESEEELFEPRKRQCTRNNGHAAAKKVMRKVEASMKSFMTNLKDDENIKDLLDRLKDRFTCTICKEVIKLNPVVCLKCGLIVGCQQCHNSLKDQEVKDDNEIIIKDKGEWKCPFCRFPPYLSDHEWNSVASFDARKPNYVTVGACDFLVNISKLGNPYTG